MTEATILLNSDHPVLQQYKDKIAELEVTIDGLRTTLEQTKFASEAKGRNLDLTRNLLNNLNERIKTVLVEALETGDNDTVVDIANNLDVDLNTDALVDFTITVRANVSIPFGKTFDEFIGELESDLDISVSGYEYISDGWLEGIVGTEQVS